jgi:hypothetical protein
MASFLSLRGLAVTWLLAMGCNPALAAPGLMVEGTEFVLHQGDGNVLRSAGLVGAELDMGDGTALRIDAVERDPKDADIWLHRLSIRSTGSDWHEACEPDVEGRRAGFPLGSRWDDKDRFHADPAHFSLSCTSGAQAKCVRYGYKFWKPAPDGANLDAEYEACVHMARADYCGEGKPSTRDGTQIDIYDNHGVQKAETGPEFRFEAGWSPTGAVCVNHTRIPKNLTLDQLRASCPRLADALGERCDDATARKKGAILFNRSR